MSAPASRAPAVSAASIHGPDSRVSRPTTILGAPPFRSANRVASERPMPLTVPGSRGNVPASPRIPSVPNSLFIKQFHHRGHRAEKPDREGADAVALRPHGFDTLPYGRVSV